MSSQREMWDEASDDFVALMQPTTTALARTLIAQLDLASGGDLLEVGAGGGGGALACQEWLPAESRHVVTDLSPMMCGHARRALPGLPVVAANAEALPFADGSFDRLLANLNLMLVTDTDAALAEAARVLRVGGLAAWSVWGRVEHSPMFTLLPSVAESLELELPAMERRSNFHLNDPADLRARIERAGFERVVCWFQPMVAPFRSGEAYVDVIFRASLMLKQLLVDLSAAQAAAFRRRYVELSEGLLSAGRPIQLETLVVVGSRSAS
jgi:ubiquinone/menaquinone biosynthesis C-methylase UbiE